MFVRLATTRLFCAGCGASGFRYDVIESHTCPEKLRRKRETAARALQRALPMLSLRRKYLK